MPKILILAGAISAQALLSITSGITKIRGQWASYTIKNTDGTDTDKIISALPVYHPAYLLRRPQAKREAWQDLLTLSEKYQRLSENHP